MVILIYYFLLTTTLLNAQTRDQVNEASERARRLLSLPRNAVAEDNTDWLPNSNKIGLGYNLMTGSPVCFTDDCQVEGFGRSVLKLSFIKRQEGACTSKLIPNIAELDCRPSTLLTANTQTISTLDQLQDSMLQSIEISGNLDIKLNAFSYDRSTQTSSMIDTIVQKNSTAYFTRAFISYAQLSIFEPNIELSDDFRAIIANMPCCNDSEEIQSYIKEFVIGYFGYTYIKELLLGGIAQQTITITEENRRSLVKNGFSKTENGEYSSSALGIFKIKAGFKVTDEFNESKLAIFSQYSQQSSVVTFGGSTTLQSIETWSSTVPGNPAAIKLKTEPLVNLLTERTFPGDPNIAAKQALIQSAVTKYITKEVFCYNKCSYPNGVCPPTSNYFGFAKCVCTSGYTGYDCSKPKYVPTGILAQSEPGEKCLQGNTYFKQLISSYDTSCFLGMCDTTYNYWQGCHFSNYQLGMAGGTANTLCGISYGDLTILCDGMNPGSEPCPTQYTRINTGTDFFWTCVKQSSVFSDDLPGTLCGLHSRKDDGKHIACGGFYPGAGKCPTGYTLRQGVAHSRGGGFVSTCSKD